MNTIMEFDTRNSIVLPPQFRGDDVRFSDSFAEYFIERFTKPGDTVFDPFAGFGTVLSSAEKLGRRAIGIEYLPDRAAYIRENMQDPGGIVCGSALDMDGMDLPMVDFVLTSPPFMQRTNHPEYPFAGYRITGQGYEDYLSDIAGIFGQVAKRMAPGAHAVIEVSNLLIDGDFTPLAWDVARYVGGVLPIEHEIIIKWLSGASPAYGFGFDHSYALVFGAPRAE